MNEKYTYWTKTKELADQFTPEAKRIIGETLIREATASEDIKGTDLFLPKKSFALRIRNYSFFKSPRTRGDLTIRFEVAGGGETEYHKLILGRGPDLYFLGYAAAHGKMIKEWAIIKTEYLANELFYGDPPVTRSSKNGPLGVPT